MSRGFYIAGEIENRGQPYNVMAYKHSKLITIVSQEPNRFPGFVFDIKLEQLDELIKQLNDCREFIEKA